MFMKRIFIRALWGTLDTSFDNAWTSPSARRGRMNFDVKNILGNPYTVPFITYVFGEDNYKFLLDKGLNCVLINKQPFIYDLQTEFWRHKLDILKYAMENDGYNEIVYLDWDCIPQKPLTDDFWAILSSKREIQANLQYYRRRKCKWRGKDETRKVSNGGFLYIRGSEIPQKLVEAWTNLPSDLKFWDEVAFSKYIDDLMGGWKGLDAYWKDFEPGVCNLKKRSAFSDELVNSKNVFFIHYIQSGNNKHEKKIKQE